MQTAIYVAATGAAYLLGSIPTAYLLGRLARGIDIRYCGTGNVGALNTFREVGPAAGIAVLLLDALKGMLAVYLPWAMGAPQGVEYFTVVAVVVGHNWPVFLGFHGGKGAATIAGSSLVVLPWLTLASLLPTLVAGLIMRRAVAGIVVGFVALNLLIVVTGQGWDQVAMCLFLSLLVGATYLGGSWDQTVSAVRRRRWLELFSFE